MKRTNTTNMNANDRPMPVKLRRQIFTSVPNYHRQHVVSLTINGMTR